MWMIGLAITLQICVIFELVLNRLISIFANTARNPTRKLADGSFFVSLYATITYIVFLPVTLLGSVVDVTVQQASLWLSIIFLFSVVAVLSEASGGLVVLFANTYNTGIGEVVHTLVISVVRLVAPLARLLLPFWNAFVYITVVFWSNTFLPFVYVNVDVIPTLLLDLSMLASTLAFSCKAYVEIVVQCATEVLEVDTSVSPFWVNDLRCVASPYAMTLDLMTPGIYMQKSAVHVQAMLQGSCGSSTSFVTLLLYPLIDYNMYKALHGGVNAVLHLFITMPIWTSNRCAYAKQTSDHVYTELETKMMCVPDLSAISSIMRGTVNSFGLFIDNYLDVALVVVETAVSGKAPTCAHPSVQAVWQGAGDVFGTQKLQVVGLTRSLYAVTDGTSVTYQSNSGGGMRSSFALHTFPFQVDLSLGLAAVRYSEASDADDDGDERTGIFGCRCIDGSDGLQILCASVPYQTHLAEDDAENEAATVHRVRFMNERARVGLTCATVVVRVNALRFSRRRFSTPSMRPSVQGGFGDPFDTRGDTGEKYATAHAADASVTVMPLCTVEGSVFCMPSSENCYPFCMGLHAAGQSTQNISLMNSATWNEYTSLGQTDCVVSESERACSTGSSLAVNDGVGVRIRGCSSTLCSPDASTTTFIKNIDDMQNRSMSTWHANETWGFIRTHEQPFVIAGDIFLYQKQTDERHREGLVFVTRLYDNKRGDFSLNQEQLSLVTNSDAIKYVECATEDCFDDALLENHIVLPDQFFTRASFIAAVSEWAVHWVAAPDLNRCSVVFDYCAGTTGGLLTYNLHRPRLWTIRTVHSTDEFGKVDATINSYASFMVIPDWFRCELSQNEQCQRIANMKVTALEYMNPDNLLLTVMAASPAHWDVFLDDIRDGMPFEYRYYFVHPNKHDCTSPGISDDPVYTCWREHSAGMYNASDTLMVEAGSLCPAMQRMPKWGSLAAEVAAGTLYGLSMVIDLCITLPVLLSVSGGMNDVFAAHTHPTFHSMLDTNGARLFDFDGIILSVDRAAFHAGNTLARISMLFDERPGFEFLKPVLIGTGRIYQYTAGQTKVEGYILGGMSTTLNSIPLQAFIEKLSGLTQSPPATPMAVTGSAGKTNLVQMFTSAFSSSVSWTKVTLRVSRKLAIKLLRRAIPKKQSKLAKAAANLREMTRTLLVATYDSEGDFKRYLFMSMKVVCDSAGQAVGRTSPWGQFVRHSCMIWPESLEAVMKAAFVLFVDYPVMDCVCKQPVGFNAADILEAVCLPRIMPMAAKAFVLVEIPDPDPNAQPKSKCFEVMDSINDKLLKVMDPVLSRMYKAQTALESGMAALVSVDLTGAATMGSGCTDWTTSPFVVSILPEPVDYFMGCMETIDCRSRCLDPVRAFETSLNSYRAAKGAHRGFERAIDIQTSSLYFSTQDEFDGKHLAPFVVYSVVLLQEDICKHVCSMSTQDSSRCVSVAGMDTQQQSRPQGSITQAYYCVPASVTLSVFRGSIPDSHFSGDMYADAALRNAVVTAMSHGTTHNALRGKGEWIVLSARDFDTGVYSVLVMPPGNTGISVMLLRTVDFHLSLYADTADVNDARWNVQQINKVFVLAANSNRRWMTVYVSATRTEPYLFESKVCVFFYIDTSSEGSLYDGSINDCSEYHDAIFSPNQRIVCLDADCSEVLRVPHETAAVTFDKIAGYNKTWNADEPSSFDWTLLTSKSFKMSQNQRAVLDMPDTPELTVVSGNRVQFASRQMSVIGKVHTRTVDGAFAVHIAMTGRAQTQESWLQNIDVQVPSTGGANVKLQVAPSMLVKQRLEIVVNCSISSCQGCQGSGPLEIDLQNKCFQAASCGIAVCVGTPVNMQRPLCQMASLIGANADMFRVGLAAFWDTISRTIIGVVELSANRRKVYEVSWPAEIVQMGVCNTKDAVIEFWAVFGAMVGRASSVNLDNTASYGGTTMSVSKEARTAGLRVMSATAFVELMSHISMGVVYAPIIAWKMMECQLNSAFVVLSGGGSTMRVGTAKFDKHDEAAIGMCMQEKIKQELRDMANPSIDSDLQRDMSGVGSNIVSMVSGGMLGPMPFTFDAMCAWALGVIKGLMNVVQVLDWTNCKLPSIDNAVVSRCVCGDKAARIAQQQRDAKRTVDSLWCYGPLMLTDTTGNDVLIWNPYSLSDLFRMQEQGPKSKFVEYLDCISMDRCNFRRLVPESAGKMEDYILCLKQAPFQLSQKDEDSHCIRFQAYTDCIHENVDCEALKPKDDVFDAQGVEVMQVITRCRNNYQQKRWDEASVLLGLLEYNAWTNDIQTSVDALSRVPDEDYLAGFRKQMSKLSQFMQPFVDLDVSTWTCLQTAMLNKKWKHNCAELAYSNGVFPAASDALTFFEYEVTSDAYTFVDMDACQSFSGRVTDNHDSSLTYPKMVWDGDSANAVPVADYHRLRQADIPTRHAQAEQELDDLMQYTITPAMKRFTENKIDDIVTTFWSMEGDYIHQLVDCYILGPYSAADMLPAFRTSGHNFKVPQYHRGSGDTREIKYDLHVSGSDSRKQLMDKVIHHVSGVKDEILLRVVTDSLNRLRETYAVKRNLYCQCIDGSRSLACCMRNHDDLQSFGHTFAAQQVVNDLKDSAPQFLQELAHSISTSNFILRDIWTEDEFAFEFKFDGESAQYLAEEYMFNFEQTIYHYDDSEIVQGKNHTLWSMCMSSLKASFFSMPVRRRSDATVEVDVDTIFDPTELPPHNSESYLHGMEQFVERMLERSKKQSPVFWTHVHRYMPSDSVWCEGGVHHTPVDRRAAAPDPIHTIQFNSSAVRAPHMDEVLYVAQAMDACVCGGAYSGDTRTCLLPASLCDLLEPAPEDHSRWTALCLNMEYSTPSDFMFIRRVIEYSSIIPEECAEYDVSTVWGLMDSNQHMQWYNGSHQDWKLSLHEIATTGPSGTRLSDFLPEAPRKFGASNAWAREAGIFNTHYEHTIAQPVCNQSVPDFLKRDLSEHFRDVLFPMAHSVHEAPSHAVCGRWVVEYSMYVFLLQTVGNSTDMVFEQRAVEQKWRRRCQGQLEQVGICNLRGVYTLAPNASHQSADHCPYTVPVHHGCRSFFVTDDCLLMCNGFIYDPCLCDGAVDCVVLFTEDACASARIMLPPSSAFDLASMHWPLTVWPPRQSTAYQDLLDEVNANMTVHGITFYIDDDMTEYVLMHTDTTEGSLGDSFCDDLVDYMDPTAQHPVGYHPTTSCFKSETNMRGFTSWMTTGGDAAWSVDPVRVRNMSSYSTTLGYAHLTCDAAVYGIRGQTLNNLFMESKWSGMSRADAAVPIPADRVSEENMESFGEGSMDAHDTPLQAHLDSHLKFQHTVGLVRDWLRYYGDDDNGTIQQALDDIWPHWQPVPDDSYGARPQDNLHDGCAMPPLFTCKEHADCRDFTESLQCLFMSASDDAEDLGICVSVGTCFRHSHCGSSQMCSGKGVCEDPEITVHNEHDRHIDLQLHALDSTQCRLPPYGLGKHQNIPSFAADNGLCGVRNFFNYNETTYAYRNKPAWQRTDVVKVPNRIIRPISSHSSSRNEYMQLTDSQFPTLYSKAHECDRTYEHSDHKLCSPVEHDGIKVSLNSRTPFPTDVRTIRTWTETNGDVSVNFCNLYTPSDGVTEMLNPYKHIDEATLEEQDTLIETRRDIKRCLDFDNICMQSTYTVRGSKVEVRLVTEVVGMREHQVKDVEMCMAFGVWNQEKELCYLDKMVVPLFECIYRDQSGVSPTQDDLDVLRTSCPSAFGKDYDEARNAFEQLYIKLKNPYTTQERMQMQTTVNEMILRIFDMAPDSSKNRGLENMQTYQQKAQCIKHLYTRLREIYDSNALALSVYGVDKSQVPGTTTYLFSGTAPVEVTLLWLWKCVVVAKQEEGGVSVQWLRIMTSETEEGLQCDNVDMQSDMDMTLRRHLQLQTDIYTPNVDALVNINLYTDILSTLEDTINFWDFYPVPTIFCHNTSRPPHCTTEQQQFGMVDTACGRIAAKDTFIVPDPLQNLNMVTMVEIMTLFLFKRTRAQVEATSGISLERLLADKLAIEVDLDTTLSRTINYTNAIPVFELTALNNMTAILGEADRDIYQIAPVPASCTSDTRALQKSEYQILRTICEHSDAGIDTEQSAMYQKIMTFRELTISRKNFLYEDFQCYGTGNDLYASVSQKAAFILTVCYFREILHASAKSKLGRLDADQDIRNFMWADVELSRNHVLHNYLSEAREYDVVMRARRFLCDKNKDYSKYQESSMQLKLKACTKSLKISTGWQIPSKGNSISLQPKSDFFMGGFFLTFSSPFSASGVQTPFIEELVDTPWHEPGHMYAQRQMCFKSTLGATRLSPLWSGNLDVQSCPFTESCGCETVLGDDSLQYMDITCDDSDSMLSCERDFPLFYSLVQSKIYPTCAANQHRVVPLAMYEQMKEGNLCARRPRDTSTCSTHFGAVGGVVGGPVGDLHREIPVRHFQIGLFSNQSKLLQGFLATDSENVHSIRMKDTDIGGNSVGFTVHRLGIDGKLVMEVTCVSVGLNCRSKVTRRWLEQSENLWQWQHTQHVAHSVSPASRTVRWSCPLQWISAYGDNRTAYVARSPSASRNAHRFRHITGARFFAHAVVSTRFPVAQHPARFISDASACTDGRISPLGLTFSCRGRDLLLDAIQLHNRRWTTVKFPTSSPKCIDILDWPHRAFRTMDGANGGTARDSSQYCNVFDRLPSFALRYSAMPTDVLRKNVNAASTSAGGACHMGRLKKIKKSNETDMLQFCTAFETHSSCRVLQKNAQSEFSWSSKDIPVHEPFVAQKRKPSRKRRCSLCESHAESSFIDRRSNETPLRTNVRQLSVGVPTSISPERLIAANLRRKICPSAGADCPLLYEVLPRESWQQHKLMRGLLNLSNAHQHSMPPAVRDDGLWNEPWVFCKRNSNITSCSGVVPKEEWTDPSLRSGACSREMIGANDEDRKPIRLCDLSDELQDLCVQLGTWNSKIEYILCKAAGHRQCSEHGFFYNPTAYSLSNQDFVYNTVRKMYHQYNDSACPAVYVNKQELQNEILRGKCGSVALEPLRTIVKTARGFAYDLTVILYCDMQIFVYLSGVIIGFIGSLDTLIAESSRNLLMYIHLLLGKVNSIMDRLMKMLWKLAEFGAFKWIKKAAALFCVVLEDVIKPLMTNVIHPAASMMAEFIGAIDRDLTRPLVKFINDFSFGKWDASDMIETNRKNIDFWKKTAENAKNFVAKCEEDGVDEDSTDPIGVLPVATKCWSTYTTFFGDNSMLSCTAADTCHSGVTDTRLVTCGICPEPQTSFRQFGCFDITKICTCSVPVLSLQYCTANEDCSTTESSCKYLDSELEPSMGFTPCSSCQSSRLCYMQPGMSMGYCACGLFQIKFARCSDHAKNVNPGYDDMCIFTSDPNFLASVTFAFSFDTAISTPCRMINPAFAFCARETNGQLYVVGTDISRRRHLLQVASGDEHVEIQTASVLCQDALASDAMPHMRAHCVALFHESRLTVHELGLDGTLPPCAFCGIEDVYSAFVMTPRNMIAITTNISAVLRVVARHTPLKHVLSTFKVTRRYIEVMLHSIDTAHDDELPLIRHTRHGWQVDIASNDTVAVFLLETVFPQVLNWAVLHNESAHGDARTSRRLLSAVDTASDSMQAAMNRAHALHRSFQTQLSLAFTFPFESSEHRSAWMSAWPPDLGRRSTDAEDTCPPLLNVIRGFKWTFGNLSRSFDPITMKTKPTLAASWVAVPRQNATGNSSKSNDAEDAPTSAMLWLSQQILQTVGLQFDSFYDLVQAAVAESPKIMRCNYESVQTCSRWDMHALHAIIITAVYFTVFVLLCGSLQMSLLPMALLGVFPAIVMYMSYGYSPFCAPMLPVCIMDDLLWTVNSFLPVVVEFPPSMFVSVSCIPKRNEFIQKNCLRSCSDPPFEYRRWYDVMAWWATELGWGDPLETYASFILSSGDVGMLQDQLALKHECLVQGDASLVAGNRICAALSMYKAFPYIILLFLSIFFLGTIVRTVWSVTCAVLFSILVLFITAFY